MGKKTELRNKFLSIRKNTDSSIVQERSKAINEHLIKSDIFNNSKVIMTYLNYPKEIQTDYLFIEAIRQNKIVSVPVCQKATIDLIPSRITALDQVEIGYYGLREPKKEYFEPIDPKIIDLIIVPGVVFDLKGNRIGHGKGYYDNFFNKIAPSTLKIGFAFQFQITEESWDIESWDVPVDGIITENGVVYRNFR